MSSSASSLKKNMACWSPCGELIFVWPVFIRRHRPFTKDACHCASALRSMRFSARTDVRIISATATKTMAATPGIAWKGIGIALFFCFLVLCVS